MKFKNTKLTLKNLLISAMLALTILGGSILTTNLYRQEFINTPVYAYKNTQDNITNSKFTSYSTSTAMPYAATGWTFVNPTNNKNIKNGIIDVANFNEETRKACELDSIPDAPHGEASDALNKHLMLNSYAGWGRVGYTSTPFSLNSNSFYSVSVSLRTNDQALASIYVNGLSNIDDAQITRISTLSGWETYTIFMQTDESDSQSASIELWLGDNERQTTKGAVFFNKIELTNYSKASYIEALDSTDKNSIEAIAYQPIFITGNDFIDNPMFDAEISDSNTIPGWTTTESSHDDTQNLKIISTQGYNPKIDTAEGIANPKTNDRQSDDNILFMHNKESGKQGIKSNAFTIKQNELYKLTVWAKSDCKTGSGATIKVVEENPNADNDEEDFVASVATLQVNTSITSNAATNNWNKYNIYIEGHPLKNTTATLQLLLGDESSTNGYVFFDDISLEKINYSIFENGANTSNSATYTFNNENTAFTIENGNFNIGYKQETILTYPLKPASWELSTPDDFNEEYNFSGIINTNTNHFANTLQQIAEKTHSVTLRNPGLTPVQNIDGATLDNSSNNVLMLANTISTSQNYTSTSFSLSASTYYKISMLVNTQFTKPINFISNYGVQVKLENSTFTTLDVLDIDTNGEWQEFSIYVCPSGAFSAFNLQLALNNVQGFAFFDDVIVETITEEIFNNAPAKRKANLDVSSNETFDLVDHTNTTSLKNIYNWKADNISQTDSVIYGSLNTDENIKDIFQSINNPGSQSGNHVLTIYSNEETNFTFSAIQKIDLSMESFYKIIIKVKTLNIGQDNHKYDENGKLIEYGAFIGLDGYDKSFTGIDTERDGVNGYATYTFYISPNADTNTFVILGLGNEDNLAYGYAFFDSVTVTEIDEVLYNEGFTDQSKRTMHLTDQKPPATDSDTENGFVGAEFDWYIIPSLLITLAIIIAIVGVTVKRIKLPKITKKIKTKYDRRKTLEVELDKRERIELRNEIIKELNNEYDDIDNEISQLEKDLESKIAEIKQAREDKLKAYEAVKQSIIVEREQATRDYNNNLINTPNLTEAVKLKYEKEFKKYINKLEKRSSAEAKKINKEDKSLIIAEQKHTENVKKLTERQKLIQEEIEKVEREIEEIAKQEAVMWSEYKKAKEEAKKQKLEYIAEQKTKKESLKNKKVSSNKTDKAKDELNQTDNNDNDKKENTQKTVGDKETAKDEPKDNNANETSTDASQNKKSDEVVKEINTKSDDNAKKSDEKTSNKTDIKSSDTSDKV